MLEPIFHINGRLQVHSAKLGIDRLTDKVTWEVTELNTRRRRFRNEVNDILYGDNYKKHTFKTKEEAYAKIGELEGRGIKTSIARVIYS